jgi:glutamyl-Q tRNA(Asp) synthetase
MMTPIGQHRYTGRFAPTPTGPLHFGSLITALASYCEAHAQHGQWLVRIEDTDIPRNQQGAEALIRQALDAFALQSDQPIVRQQDRLAHYQHAIDHLAAQGLVYGCGCSRKQLSQHPHDAQWCRAQGLPLAGHAVRLIAPDRTFYFVDAIQGPQSENLTETIGDLVLRRRDGIISYQLAVVIDDAAQGVTDVVRGADLLDNTVRQIWLAECLGLPRVRYAHVPLAMNAEGQKLSKQNLAMAVDLGQAGVLMRRALIALGQPDPQSEQPAVLLQRAVDRWSLARVPHHSTLLGVYQ